MSAHAPRAWAKRVLSWLILDGGVLLYFANGTMVERIPAYRLRRYAESISDAKILNEAEKAVLEREEKAVDWNEISEIAREIWANEPKPFPIEISFFLDVFDWELGKAQGNLEHSEILAKETWEDLGTQYEDSYWDVDLSGMCFNLQTIEMLAPNAATPVADLLNPATSPAELSRKGGPGRRREYDWDGALLHLIGQAEINAIAPDPDAHGAQADITRVLADWFSDNGGKVPAESQLQSMAKRALDAIRAAKP